tara:strand:- start:566 stop:922 length:357 start_codon:yes stop_codon:yes gene_type:complete
MNEEEGLGEVVLVLRPDVEGGKWTGEITTTILIRANGKESEAIKTSIDSAVCMLASLELANESPDFLDELIDYRLQVLKDFFPDAYAHMEKQREKDKEYTSDGKVIRLTKWTKTEGSA